MNLYCVWSKVASKTLAKGAASLKCIKLLHESGELNDWLVTNGSKASEKAEKLELVAASKGIISYHTCILVDNEDDANEYIHSLVHITSKQGDSGKSGGGTSECYCQDCSGYHGPTTGDTSCKSCL